MCGTHSYYNMGVAMIDLVTVIVYTLHAWGPLELHLFLQYTGLSREAVA